MRTGILVASSWICLFSIPPALGQWNQWRGPERNGNAPESPPLRNSLPEVGLLPLWTSEPTIRGGGNGGWASPIVAEGRVYQFVHWHQPREDVKLDAEEYPALSDKQQEQMDETELQRYEASRRQEQLERRERSHRHLETVYCFDAQIGSLQWQSDRESVATGFSQSCTPLVDNGRLYLHGADRKVVCMDAHNGDVIWTVQMPVSPGNEQMPSSPVLVDGTLVVLMGRLFGVDAQTGELRWEGEPNETAGRNSSPVVYEQDGQNVVIFNVDRGRTLCADPQTGEVLWNVDSKASNSTPVIAGNRLLTFGHSRSAGLRCFDLGSSPPKELWAFRGASDSGSSPVVVDGSVYVQGENRLACVDLDSGKASWQTSLDLAKPRYTSLVAADGKVFYAFDGVLCFEATTEKFRPLISVKADEQGRLNSEEHFRAVLNMDELERTSEGQQQALKVWQENIGHHGPLDCASPAIADGKLYVRLKSKLACYDLRKPEEEITALTKPSL